jgi:hypothetical protein
MLVSVSWHPQQNFVAFNISRVMVFGQKKKKNKVSQDVKAPFRDSISFHHVYIFFVMTLEVIIRPCLWFIFQRGEGTQSDALAGSPS